MTTKGILSLATLLQITFWLNYNETHRHPEHWSCTAGVFFFLQWMCCLPVVYTAYYYCWWSSVVLATAFDAQPAARVRYSLQTFEIKLRVDLGHMVGVISPCRSECWRLTYSGVHPPVTDGVQDLWRGVHTRHWWFTRTCHWWCTYLSVVVYTPLLLVYIPANGEVMYVPVKGGVHTFCWCTHMSREMYTHISAVAGNVSCFSYLVV